MDETNVFQLFSPPLAKALQEKGFVSPTDPQMKLVPLVISGSNALLMAPTGTGKTEAAFLPILDNIIRNELARTRGIKLLYVTPLRALNRDMLERMKWWCRRFDVQARGSARRHNERREGQPEHGAPGHTDYNSGDSSGDADR